jgi:exopolysaccharide biosynthesis protein
MADIMEYIGCYTAQNLDGGGSTNMVIGSDNITNPTVSRRLSVGLAVLSLKNDKTVKLPKRRR